MAKAKLKQPPNKSGTEMEDCVDNSWVVVKKQKVTILIPSLPIAKQPTTPNPQQTPSQPMATKRADHITAPAEPLAIPKPDHMATTPGNPQNEKPNFRKTLRICNASRKHCGSLFNGHAIVSSSMRALNLERKLQRAGGLNSWLVSIGLGQFVNIFRCKRVGKVQLVNLTMKKLKDMGADAVGPRRKLMHAIDCLW